MNLDDGIYEIVEVDPQGNGNGDIKLHLRKLLYRSLKKKIQQKLS